MKRNFLPAGRFFDQQDFDEQLVEWMVEVADVRVHGTTHELADRLLQRRARAPDGHRRAAAGFRLETLASCRWALTTSRVRDANRSPAPFRPIGETVQVQRLGEQLQVLHRG